MKSARQAAVSETKDTVECPECRNAVRSSDEFCMRCGTLLVDGFGCHVHRDRPADGACIICCLPFCRQCGKRGSGRFLCNDHSEYELYEGMARIHGTLDDIEAHYAASCLEQAGFHPYLFCRVEHRGNDRFIHPIFNETGMSDGHPINEIKIMVPIQETVSAEKLLRKLLTSSRKPTS